MTDKKTNSWPGILTGTAAIITAIAALIGVLKPSADSKTETDNQTSQASPEIVQSPAPKGDMIQEPSSSPSSSVPQPQGKSRQVAANRPSSKVTFSCETSEYKGKTIPATLVNKDKSSTIFLWKLDNNYFGENWPPQKRCEEVAERLQRIYERDGLKYLVATIETWIPNQEIPVICGVKRVSAACDKDDLLITLESTDNPDEVLQEMLNRRKLPSEEPPVLRGDEPPENFAEGKRVYYDISELFSVSQPRSVPQERVDEEPLF